MKLWSRRLAGTLPLLLLPLLLPLLPMHPGERSPQDDPAPAAPAGFEAHTIRGWTVLVHESMRERESARLDEALDLLSCRLHDLSRALPAAAVARLQTVKIWFDPRDRHHPCAVYHPSAGWLERNGYDVAKADCMHITHLERFLDWSREQPSMVLHELAHAYHDQVLGFDHPAVLEAYGRAVESGTYDEVLSASGRPRRHYALSDAKEFFAELTETAFGTNDYYPFVRAELLHHDPRALELIERLWKDPAR